MSHDHSAEVLDGVDLSYSTFTLADLTGSSLLGAKLDNAVFSQIVAPELLLAGASLELARIDDAVLTSVVLDGAQARGAYLVGSDMRGAHASDVDLSLARLNDCDLSGADLSGAILTGANLISADLSGADLTNADLTDAVLINTSLEGAMLSGADLTGAVISLGVGSAFYDACTDLSDTEFDPVKAGWVDLTPADPLIGCGTGQLSVTDGGTQGLLLRPGSEFAGQLYFVIGSLSGTSPGFTLEPGVHLPLNYDTYSLYTIEFPNSALLANTFSVLDEIGEGAAGFVVPQGLSLSLVGLTVHHAYVVFEGPSNYAFASNAVEATLTL
ncbi:MAG: pentapeptide repeat-containing protein [Planctomycetota bacterium]